RAPCLSNPQGKGRRSSSGFAYALSWPVRLRDGWESAVPSRYPIGYMYDGVMNGQTWSGRHWRVIAIDTPSLGNRSYVVVTRDGAVAIDPPRDIDRVETVLSEHGVDLDLVVETHRHADYISGGLVLSREHGVRYLVPAGDPQPEFRFLGAVPGESIGGAGILLDPIATPRHTPHHLSYAVTAEGRDVAVFTGGAMLYGSVGRTDLVSPDLTVPLAHDQYHSVRGLGLDLAPD